MRLFVASICCIMLLSATRASSQSIEFSDTFSGSLSQWQLVGTPLTTAGGLLHVIPSTADGFPNEARIKSNHRADFAVTNLPVTVDFVLGTAPAPQGLYLGLGAQNADGSDDPDRTHDRAFLLQAGAVHLSSSNAAAGVRWNDNINPTDFRIGAHTTFAVTNFTSLTLRLVVYPDNSIRYYANRAGWFEEIVPVAPFNVTLLGTSLAPKYSVNIEPLSGSANNGATDAYVNSVTVTKNSVSLPVELSSWSLE